MINFLFIALLVVMYISGMSLFVMFLADNKRPGEQTRWWLIPIWFVPVFVSLIQATYRSIPSEI